MGMSLGDSVRVTLFGESHGAAVGALLEGVPPGIPISVETLIEDLQRRRPGRRLLSARAEPDHCEILSGVYEGQTTGYRWNTSWPYFGNKNLIQQDNMVPVVH